ncbi:putative acetyltransferase [compost metagenome]
MTKLSVTGIHEDQMGNRVLAPSDLKNVEVEFKGSNNTLIIEEGSGINNTMISFPSDSGTCIIDTKGNYRGKIRIGWNCAVVIGPNVTCTTAAAIYTAESTYALIGEDCMLAAHVIIRTEDSHAIYDVDSGERINPSRNVIIGQHVWLAEDTLILPGAKIGSGSTIGARSVVKKFIPNNCIAAGVPSKILKKNTAWERPNIAFNSPWIRGNAKEQSLIKTVNAWQPTEEGSAQISIGSKTLTVVKKLKMHYDPIDLSSLKD